MTAVDPPGQDAAALPNLRAKKVFRTAAALVLVLLAAGGTILWKISKPRYLKFESVADSTERIRLSLSYPADWKAEQMNYGTSSIPFQVVSLHRRKSAGMVQWMEKLLYNTSQKDWQRTRIMIQLFPYSTPIPSKDKNELIAQREEQMVTGVGTMVQRAGGSYSFHHSHFPMGSALELVYQIPPRAGTPGNFTHYVLVFPDSSSHSLKTGPETQNEMEIVAICSSDQGLRSRIEPIFYDVVQRLRVVEKPVEAANHATNRPRRR